jgi:hypothetical protein
VHLCAVGRNRCSAVIACQLTVSPRKFVLRVLVAASQKLWTVLGTTVFWVSLLFLPGILLANGPSQIQFAQPVSYSLLFKLASQGIVPQQEILAADLNGDGKPDVVAGLAGGVAVLLNNGDGTLASPIIYNIGSSGGVLAVAAIDLNQDGKLDIVGFTDNPAGLHIFLNRGNGFFLPDSPLPLGFRAKSMATGDFNGDGRVDVAVSYNTNSNGCCQSWNQIFSNQGDGTLAFLSTFSGPGNAFDCCGASALYAADVNGDGLADIVTDNGDGSFSVLINQGNGHIANPSTYTTGAPIVSNYYFADINGDGAIDIVMNEEFFAFDVAKNQGLGVFSSNLARVDNGFFLFGTPLAIGDFDNNGSVDAVALDINNDLLVFSNNGLGALGAPAQQPTTLRAVNAGVAVADFNGDGKLDFATLATDTNGYGVVDVVFNTTAAQSAAVTVSGLAPSNAQEGSLSPMRLVGAGFPSGMKVTFSGPGSNVLPTSLSISSDGTVATGTLDLTNAMPGSYSLSLSNSVGMQLLSIANVFTVGSATALRFIPATPCRVADTRNASGPFGGPYIAAGTSREFDIPTATCGIPSTAQAYALNITVVPKASLGYLTVWPTGEQKPTVSTMNSLDGRVKANAAVLAAGSNGGVSVFASNDTDVILDVNGYFVPGTNNASLAFYSMSPCRLIETRSSNGPLSGPYLFADQTRSFPISASACNVPAVAQAYSLNFTVVPRGPLAYLSTWPTGERQPLVSTLNASTGVVTANAAIVTAGLNQEISVYATSDTDLVVDINGYFAPFATGGLSLYTPPPCRVLDTRLNNGQPFSGTLVVPVTTGPCGTPVAAGAYIMNATVVPPGSLGYLALWPAGQAMPLASTLNASDGSITANMAIVPTTNGSVDAYASSPTHLLLDISGYFAP